MNAVPISRYRSSDQPRGLADDAAVISSAELVYLVVGLGMTLLGARLVGRQRGTAMDEAGRV